MAVTTIKLNKNSLGNEGAMALAKCLHGNLTVTSLELKENGIGNEGAEAIFNAISINRTMLTVDLKRNDDVDKAMLTKIEDFVNESKAIFEDRVVYFPSPDDSQDEHDIPVDPTSVSLILSPPNSSSNRSSDSGSSLYCSSDYGQPNKSLGMPAWSGDANNNTPANDGQYGIGANTFQPQATEPQVSNGAALAFNWVGMVGSHFINIDENEASCAGENSMQSSQQDISIQGSDSCSNASIAETNKINDISSHKIDIDRDVQNVANILGTRYDPSIVGSEDGKSEEPPTHHCRFPQTKVALLLVLIIAIAIISGVLATRPNSSSDPDQSIDVTTPSTSKPTIFPIYVNPSLAPSSSQNISSSIPFSSYTLSLVGQALPGESPYDQFGYSITLSNDGTILAVGSPYHDTGAGQSNSGLVQIFELNIQDSKITWELVGEISYQNAYGFLGHSICLSGDGKRIAVSEPGYQGRAGRVKVHQFVNSSWEPLGQHIAGNESGELFGYALAMSGDGKRVAVGSPSYNNGDGRLQIFEMSDGTSWVRQGSPIDGHGKGEELGKSISISHDGSIVAAGAPGAYQGGTVRIFRSSKESPLFGDKSDSTTEWEEFGALSNQAKEADQSDHFGSSVSLSFDGGRIAIGAPMFAKKSGMLAVFEFDTSSLEWAPLGGATVGSASSSLGRSVAMSPDGEHVIAGSPGDTIYGIDSGKVQIFQWNGTVFEGSSPELGKNTKDEFGFSVAISQNAEYVAVGAPVRGGEFDGGRGYARAFSFH